MHNKGTPKEVPFLTNYRTKITNSNYGFYQVNTKRK
jgi:hypothetical protein